MYKHAQLSLLWHMSSLSYTSLCALTTMYTHGPKCIHLWACECRKILDSIVINEAPCSESQISYHIKESLKNMKVGEKEASISLTHTPRWGEKKYQNIPSAWGRQKCSRQLDNVNNFRLKKKTSLKLTGHCRRVSHSAGILVESAIGHCKKSYRNAADFPESKPDTGYHCTRLPLRQLSSKR